MSKEYTNSLQYPAGIAIFDLEDSHDREILKNLWAERGTWRGPFQSIWELVTESPCPCKTVIIEEKYLDRDYADAYSRIYCTTFREGSRYCKRIHFFSDKVILEDLLCLDYENEVRRKRLQSCYMGFTVLRPSAPDTVGRTFLPHELVGSDRARVLTEDRTTVHLLGNTLETKGMPFIEQDVRVAACATAGIWMTHMSLFRKLNLTPKSTTEITELAGQTLLATGRAIPSNGLTVEQINWALSALGHEPTVKRLTSRHFGAIKEYIYSYLNSRIPIILAVRLRTGEGHVLTVAGFQHSSPFVEPATYEVRESPESPSLLLFQRSSEWIDRFIAHDDQSGPYHLLELKPGEYPELYPTINLYKGYAPNAGESIYENAELRAVIVPLVRGVTLDATEAQAKSIYMLAGVKEAMPSEMNGKPWQEPLVLRTYLTTSSLFKGSISTERGLSLEMARRIHQKLMPRFIWVTEFTTADNWNVEQASPKRILGELVLDASSNPFSLNFVLMYFPHYLLEMGPETQDTWSAVAAGLQKPTAPGDLSYTPFTSA